MEFCIIYLYIKGLVYKYILMVVLQHSLEYGCEVWNTNKFKAKALKSIQLHPCKCVLRCSRTACDEPIQVGLRLETSKCRSDFHKLNWYHTIMCVNNERLPFKLLSR